VTHRVLYLIRHGESDLAWGGDPFQGARGDQWDPPLSERGREQAERLAARLTVMDLDPFVVYSSPLRRAIETARTFATAAGVAVAVEDDLMEAHIGGWEGKSFEEIVETDPQVIHHLRHQEAIWHRAPGAELGPRFRSRVRGTIEEILARHPDHNVLVFAHGGVINAYCGALLDLPQEMFFLPENTSVNSIDIEDGAARLRFLNDVLHLTDPHFFRNGVATTPSEP
jgi:broad specificity phosphatase PhoE